MIEFSLIVNGEKELSQTLNDFKREVSKSLAKEIEDRAKKTAEDYKRKMGKHRDTGELNESISADNKGGWTKHTEIGSTVMQSVYLEYGTGQYGRSGKPITPKKPGGWLHWISKDGKKIFAKSVKGIKGENNLLKSYVELWGGLKLDKSITKRFARTIK